MSLYASVDKESREPFAVHIEHARQAFSRQQRRLLPSLTRVLGVSDATALRVVHAMLALHDVGKLTEPWQRLALQQKALPPHAALGGVVTYWYLSSPGWTDEDVDREGIAAAAGIAVAIHHTDRGLPGGNLDEPDNIAIRGGLVLLDGSIRWHPEAQAEMDALIDPPVRLERIGVGDLREAAGAMRRWGRGSSVLEMHARRMRTSLLHHVLRVCDLRAAGARGGSESPLVRRFQEGGLAW